MECKPLHEWYINRELVDDEVSQGITSGARIIAMFTWEVGRWENYHTNCVQCAVIEQRSFIQSHPPRQQRPQSNNNTVTVKLPDTFTKRFKHNTWVVYVYCLPLQTRLLDTTVWACYHREISYWDSLYVADFMAEAMHFTTIVNL